MHVNDDVNITYPANSYTVIKTHLYVDKCLTDLYYFQRIPPLRIDDLIYDLRDGTKLLALLEVLSGEKLV